MDDMFSPDPELFFDSVAGPDILGVAGPPGGVLDTYADGTPIAEAQSAVANAVGGGSHKYFWQRGDVQAFALLVAGIALIHGYTLYD